MTRKTVLRCFAAKVWVWGAVAVSACGLSGEVVSGVAGSEGSAQVAPPITIKREVRETLHGVEVVDPYRWLEDSTSAETRTWLEQQIRYSQSQLETLPATAALQKRFTQLLRVEQLLTPPLVQVWLERGGQRYFYAKRPAGQDLYAIYVREGESAHEQVLIDPDRLSANHDVSVTLMAVSRDGRFVAYGVREGGADEVSVHFFDVDARRDVYAPLVKGRYASLAFAHDASGVYYSIFGTPKVQFHSLNQQAGPDRIVFDKGYSPDKLVGVSTSEDGRWLVIEVHHGAAARKMDVHVYDVVHRRPIEIVTDVEARFLPDIGGDTLFLQTDWDAPNSRVIAVDLRKPARKYWREIIPEQKNAVLQSTALAGGQVIATYLENVQSKIKVFDAQGKFVRNLDLPVIGTVGAVRGLWSSPEAFYAFSTFHIPPAIYRYDVKSGTQRLWAQTTVPVDSAAFELKQVWFSSKDGTRVPMFILHRKGLTLDGLNPTILYGYGGYNISLTPLYSTRAIAWVERGGVYAYANLRGGGEFGEDWHKAGILEKKQNVFDDFIAAAEWLTQNRYTNPGKLAVYGASNGGLLVGAVMTQRPELFRAAVCGYPVLDMLRYQELFPTVSRMWIPEYGSAEDPNQFKFLRAYSPYHNVKAGVRYPAILFVTGDADTRVAPAHVRKMAAALQAATSPDRPVLMRYDTKSGHIGSAAAPVSKQIEEQAQELAFLSWQLESSDTSESTASRPTGESERHAN